MSRNLFLSLGLAALGFIPIAACSYSETGEQNAEQVSEPSPDPMASHDDPAAKLPPEDRPRPLMQAQVVLDRIGFTPGVIDGKIGMSTVNALKGFQEARGREVTGELDQPTQQALAEWQYIPATRVVTIPAEFANDRFVQIPEEREDQACGRDDQQREPHQEHPRPSPAALVGPATGWRRHPLLTHWRRTGRPRRTERRPAVPGA